LITPANAALVIGAPAAVLAVLTFVLSSGRMSRPLRRRVELFLMALAFPAFIGFWGWQAIQASHGHAPILISLLIAVIRLTAWSGVNTFRKWRRAA
jgi:hypothetical protein